MLNIPHFAPLYFKYHAIYSLCQKVLYRTSCCIFSLSHCPVPYTILCLTTSVYMPYCTFRNVSYHFSCIFLILQHITSYSILCFPDFALPHSEYHGLLSIFLPHHPNMFSTLQCLISYTKLNIPYSICYVVYSIFYNISLCMSCCMFPIPHYLIPEWLI